ncbi:hypothetical protein OFM04_36700, partial [Escherichia coli]|nr:hypothetical protein [Escherichia coli]
PGGDVSEFNAKTMLQIMAFADSSATESSKITARERVRRLALEVAQLIYSEQDLGGRRCDVKILKTFRGWSKIQTRLYAT